MIDRVESAMTDHRARLMLATLGFLRLVAWPRRRAHRAEDRGGPAMKAVRHRAPRPHHHRQRFPELDLARRAGAALMRGTIWMAFVR